MDEPIGVPSCAYMLQDEDNTLQKHPVQSLVILSVQLALSFSSLHVPDWHCGPPLGSSGNAIHHCPH